MTNPNTPNTTANTTVTNANTSPLQSNFQDAQIYEIDINKIYQDYIQSIDSRRSYVNVIGQNTTQLLQAIGGDPEAPTTNNLHPAKTYQESRCHTFFRIIGFPVVDANNNIYNPGHDIVNPGNLEKKIAIANNPITGFTDLSNFREQYVLKNLKIFANPTMVDAGVLALSGGANPKGQRSFQSSFLKNTGVFDTNIAHQTYPGVYDTRVGNLQIDLSQYYDASYNVPLATTLPVSRFHIIPPFIVDPRIDFVVSPSTNRIAVPFVPNKSYLRVSATEYADVPILEVVIRDVLAANNNQIKNSGSFAQSFANFIQAIDTAPDETILGQISQNDIQQLSQNAQFLQFLNIIQAMIIKLVEAQANIAKAQGQYYWLPAPSLTGPEGGSSVQGVFLPPIVAKQPQIKQQLITTTDGSILIKTAQSLFSSTNQNSQASASQGIPDTGGFAVSLKNSLGPSASAAYVNNSIQTLDTLNAKRQSTLASASDSLKIVEIVLGEFSGLGLCDIIAILATLYTMTPSDLLGFLDDAALARLNQQYNPSIAYTSPGVNQALTSFSSTITQFYQLMDAIYQKIAGQQGLSV
jgi:hypothetical protein